MGSCSAAREQVLPGLWLGSPACPQPTRRCPRLSLLSKQGLCPLLSIPRSWHICQPLLATVPSSPRGVEALGALLSPQGFGYQPMSGFLRFRLVLVASLVSPHDTRQHPLRSGLPKPGWPVCVASPPGLPAHGVQPVHVPRLRWWRAGRLGHLPEIHCVRSWLESLPASPRLTGSPGPADGRLSAVRLMQY